MLRDETASLIGAARGEVVRFPVAAPLCDIEKAWIHTCQQPGFCWPFSSAYIHPGSLEHRILSGLERVRESGKISTAHVAVVVRNGELGRPPNINFPVAYALWCDTMKALAAEVNLRSEQTE